MRVTTLKVGVAGVGGLVAYYAKLVRDPGQGPVGYYVDPEEPPGRWWGAGRSAVGLEREVVDDQLASMLEGQHPLTGKPLGRGYGDRSARGFDATFSAPKSVSLLWALSLDETVQAEVLAAHDTAVEAALGWLERHGCVTRRGKDGIDQVDADGLTVALFREHTSRALDPQLHTHAVIWAKVQDRSGRWLALDARFLLRQQRSLSWIYDSALRAELTRRLGVSWAPIEPGSGQADVVGISSEAREVFSQRSDQVDVKLAELINRWSAENDGAMLDQRMVAILERRAVLASRPDKQHGTSPTSLRDDWQDRIRAVGLDLSGVVLVPRPAGSTPLVDRDAIVREAIARVSEQASTWIGADLAREIAALVPPACATTAEGLVALVEELAEEAASRCLDLHPPTTGAVPHRRDGRPVSEHVTERAMTTSDVLVQERRLAIWADFRLEPAPEHDPQHDPGHDPQHEVARAVAGRGRLVLVVGPAGAGKTTAIRAGVDALRAQGRPALGLAPSGKAADVLAETAGCPATTLASLLHREATGQTLPEPGTTVVLDEAGMARTDDIDGLTSLAERHQWRLVCVGDPEQLPAVGRAGMFAYWCDTLPAHRLDQIHRFDEAWQRSASLALRRGDPTAAAAYVEHGRIATIHPALLPREVADQYLHVAARGESLAITTSTAATARAINTEIQRRRAGGGLRGPAVGLLDGTVARTGDCISTRLNQRHLVATEGASVRNRHTWHVAAVGPDGSLTASHPDRGTVVLPPDYVARHVELGWAVTAYGSQGVTSDHGVCVIEPASSRAGIYVGLTRWHGDIWKPAREAAGFPALRFHDLRHSAVPLWVETDANLLQVSRWLGHSSVQITADVYGHLFHETNDAVMRRLDEVFDNVRAS